MQASELILNKDKSVYHLGLLPNDIANTIITVGDPKRVAQVSKHFKEIEVKKEKREFITHTGSINGKRVSVVSTGIGTDNIDIVMNELHLLAIYNDSMTSLRSVPRKFNIIRIGTTASITADIEVDTFIANNHAVSLDGLMHHYQEPNGSDLLDLINKQIQWPKALAQPYLTDASTLLLDRFESSEIKKGISYTANGFYGPQFRGIHQSPKFLHLLTQIQTFKHGNLRFTNIEMETAGIYGMANFLGHNAISLNAVLANRVTGTFSNTPEKTVETLIALVLSKI
ncbi:MAG: uridine phosphorylase [Candidatus Azotimanducaceae bacterium]|jgi:uridine phosphorylase